jgi:hypothetical protein
MHKYWARKCCKSLIIISVLWLLCYFYSFLLQCGSSSHGNKLKLSVINTEQENVAYNDFITT